MRNNRGITSTPHTKKNFFFLKTDILEEEVAWAQRHPSIRVSVTGNVGETSKKCYRKVKQSKKSSSDIYHERHDSDGSVMSSSVYVVLSL